jgi:hypothetical protein
VKYCCLFPEVAVAEEQTNFPFSQPSSVLPSLGHQKAHLKRNLFGVSSFGNIAPIFFACERADSFFLLSRSLRGWDGDDLSVSVLSSGPARRPANRPTAQLSTRKSCLSSGRLLNQPVGSAVQALWMSGWVMAGPLRQDNMDG